MPCSGNGLPRGESASFARRPRVGGDHRQVARRAAASTVFGVLVQQRRAAADRPRRARREPLARGVAERAAELGMLDVGAAPAREPVRVHRVLVRLAQRRPEHPRFLRLAPRHVLVGERAHEALHGLHAVVALGRARPGAGHEPAARRQRRLLGVEAGLHAVALEERDEPLGLARARAEVRHHPAAVLGVRDGRMRRDALARVAAGLAQHRRAPHHPRHEVDLGGLRDRLVDRARHVLALARAPAIEQRGDDARTRAARRRCDRRATSAARSAAGRTCRRARDRSRSSSSRRRARGGQVRALEVGPRAVVAERRHARDDQRRATAASARSRRARARRARRAASTRAGRRRWRPARGSARGRSAWRRSSTIERLPRLYCQKNSERSGSSRSS